MKQGKESGPPTRFFYSAVCISAKCLQQTTDYFPLVTTVELQWLEHGWLVYHGCFELVLESLGTKSHSCRFRMDGCLNYL